MQHFNEYVEVRKLEDMLIEAFGDSDSRFSKEAIQAFVKTLSQNLPDGLSSISSIIDNWKDKLAAFMVPQFMISREDMTNPTPAMIDAAKTRTKIKDENYLNYMLTVFARQMLQTISPESIESRKYLNAFNTWMKNPNANSRSLMKRTDDNTGMGKDAVIDMANDIKSSTDDEEVHHAVNLALAQILTDAEMRQIALHDRRTKKGRDSISNILQTHDRSYQDFSKEMKDNPDFARRIQSTTKQRYRQFGPLKK